MKQKYWVFLHDTDDEPVEVELLLTYYHHGAVICYFIQHGNDIYEFHGGLWSQNPGNRRYWFVPQ